MDLNEQKEFYDHYWSKNTKSNSLKLRRIIKILEFFKIPKKQFYTPEVLELGSGEGILGSIISEFANVKGIELSSKAVDKANALYKKANFEQGNVLDYDFKSSKYDVVLSQEVIEHIEDQEKYVDVCHEVLKEGGFLILTTPNKRVMDRLTNSKEWSNQPIENVLTPAQLLNLLRGRFKIVKYESIIFNIGDKGYYKLINSRILIGTTRLLGLNFLREYLLGRLGFGLHQCVLAQKT